jgi:hypothetical protein
MQLQFSLIVASRGKALGHDETIDKSGITLDNHLGEGSNDRWSKLTTIRCLGDRDVVTCVENDNGIVTIVGLAAMVEIKQIESSATGQDNDFLAIFVAADGVRRQIGKMLVGGGRQRLAVCNATVKVKVGAGSELSDQCLGTIHGARGLGCTVRECSTNGHALVHAVSTHRGIANCNERILVGVGWKFTLVAVASWFLHWNWSRNGPRGHWL